MHIAVIKWIITITVLLILAFIVYRKRKQKKELITLFVSIFIALFIAEVMVRYFYPQKMDIKTIFQRDEHLGWRFFPNKESLISYAELGPHIIKTNSDGFRDKEFDLTKKKILVMGDSYVSNIGVDDDHVFTSLIEQNLPNTEVMNFGVNGYSPLQSYKLLEKWIAKTDAEHVLFFLYLRNDYTDNVESSWLLPRPTASLNSDRTDITIHPISEEFAKDSRPFSLYQISHLYV
ncbi:MAG: FeoB-associated Cys-rich membrane protein [Flavobacteriales bacterium]|nr:FeoB-associated Cys-rich membrane protein [Flavobacteriales bacterium]